MTYSNIRMKFIVVEDGLASNGPHIRQLQELSMHYILGAKLEFPQAFV